MNSVVGLEIAAVTFVSKGSKRQEDIRRHSALFRASVEERKGGASRFYDERQG